MNIEFLDQDIFFARCCTDGTDDEAAQWMNENRPSGTSGGWVVRTEPLPCGDAPSVVCGNDPTRRHIVFNAACDWRKKP